MNRHYRTWALSLIITAALSSFLFCVDLNAATTRSSARVSEWKRLGVGTRSRTLRPAPRHAAHAAKIANHALGAPWNVGKEPNRRLRQGLTPSDAVSREKFRAR
jgi:hypothetical protein